MASQPVHPSAFDIDLECNTSSNPYIGDVIEARVSRRSVLKGSIGAMAASLFGGSALLRSGPARAAGPTLDFTAVSKNLLDQITVPTGYTVKLLTALGDPILPNTAPFQNDGTDRRFDRRIGDHGDALQYFGLTADGSGPDPTNSSRGLLVQNHENITQVYLHANGPSPNPRPVAEVDKEIEAHGVSVVEISKDGSGNWSYNQNSPYNRRITPKNRMKLSEPLRGTELAKTKFSPDGRFVVGMINNCANGYTPWGTYLTCEENWAFYFKRPVDDSARSENDNISLNRYGIRAGSAGNYGWTTTGQTAAAYAHWDLSITGATPEEDFRNEAFNYGYVVEIDPYDPQSIPVKRTPLGRLGHEGAWLGPVVAGQPIVYYTGDDSRGEYVYKYVSDAVWDPADATGGMAAGDKYLSKGTLYVAKFNADGTGEWIALTYGENGLTRKNPIYKFRSQADVLVNARLAADSVGATKMDRPEWGAVNPVNGEVYFTMTNNSNRRVTPSSSSHAAVDAANPRDYNDPDAASNPNLPGGGNRNGHIIRWKELSATTFQWDIYLFASEDNGDPNLVNLSGLDATNDLSSPDGLWFARTGNGTDGLLWIQTDDGAYTDVTNCMMLAAVPGQVGDGGSVAVNGVTTYRGAAPGTNLRRFLVGCVQCEITGVDTTPDGKTMFVGIQHPGEEGTIDTLTSQWPSNQFGTAGSRPRSGVVVITRDDGGLIGASPV